MPTARQITVDAVPTTYGLGSSDSTSLKTMFPASPIYDSSLTRPIVEQMGNDGLIDGVVNDGGNWLGTFDRDYGDAPDQTQVPVGPAGLPSSPWTPNPASPGPGSANAADMPNPPLNFPPPADSGWGSGNGHLDNTSVTSEKVARQTIGGLLKGRSY